MRLVSIAAGVLLSTGTAFGVTAFVENLYVPDMPYHEYVGPSDFVDMLGSEKTVTLPAGTAVITWAPLEGDQYPMRIRPGIGDLYPSEGLEMGTGKRGGGSWATSVPGGTVTVKLQLASISSNTFHQSGSLSWTLMVFPDGGTAPAVSTWGLAVLALAMVAFASIEVRRSGRVGSS